MSPDTAFERKMKEDALAIRRALGEAVSFVKWFADRRSQEPVAIKDIPREVVNVQWGRMPAIRRLQQMGIIEFHDHLKPGRITNGDTVAPTGRAYLWAMQRMTVKGEKE